jgi:hypothetical protein
MNKMLTIYEQKVNNNKKVLSSFVLYIYFYKNAILLNKNNL